MSGPDDLRAADVPSEPVCWLWRDLLPAGMLSIIAGLPGVSKSLLAHLIVAEVTRQGHAAIVSSFEEPLRQVIRPRLEAAGADLDLVRIWTPCPIPEQLYVLKRKVNETGARLFVLDPIAAHLAHSIYNDQEVRKSLTPVARFAEESGCAFLGLAHRIKGVPRNAHPLAAVGGSGAGLAAAARVVYLVGRNPEDQNERILACAKTNLGPEPASLAFEIDTVHDPTAGDVPRLILIGESPLTAKDLLREAGGADEAKPEKRRRAIEFLVGYLRLGPRPAAEIKEDAQRQGITLATLRRAADEIGIVKPAGGRNSIWALPQHLLDQLDDEEQDEETETL